MLPDRVSNPGPLTYESGALPIALRGPAPSSVTLTFNLPEQMLQMALQLLKEDNCAKLFSNPCINVEVRASGQTQFMTFLSFDLQV